MTTLLSLSDVVSGLLCEGYNVVVLGQKFSAMKMGEQVAYRVVGRKAQEMAGYSVLTNEYINNNDLYTGAVGALDHGVRKGESIKGSAVAGGRALLASAAADLLFAKTGMEDKKLL